MRQSVCPLPESGASVTAQRNRTQQEACCRTSLARLETVLLEPCSGDPELPPCEKSTHPEATTREKPETDRQCRGPDGPPQLSEPAQPRCLTHEWL